MNRKQMLLVIAAYYKSICRTNPPPFKEYTNLELKKHLCCLTLKKKNYASNANYITKMKYLCTCLELHFLDYFK